MSDGIYAQIEISFILSDPRYLSLTDYQKTLYISLWCLAVASRREVLAMPKGTSSIAQATAKDARSIASALAVMQELGLVEWDGEKYLTICGVRDKHPRWKWKDSPIRDSSRPHENRIDKNRIDERPQQQSEAQNIESPEVLKIYEKLQYTEFNYILSRNGKGWVARMLNHFGADRIEAGIESFISWYGRKNLPFPGKDVIQEKFWQWVERQQETKEIVDPISRETALNAIDMKRRFIGLGMEYKCPYKPEQIEDLELRKELFG
jgi:hypothetical protein